VANSSCTDDESPLDPRIFPPLLQGREQVFPGAADFAQLAAVRSWPARVAAEAELIPVALAGRAGDTAGGAHLRVGEDTAPAAARRREQASDLVGCRHPVTPSFNSPQRIEGANGNTPPAATGSWWVDADPPQVQEQAEAFPVWAAGRRVGLAEPVTAALIAAGAVALCRRPTQRLDSEESEDRRKALPRR
jgi:hypothetical protein